MYPNQSLHTWPPKRRRTRMRFPVASQKTALSTTRGGIIAVVTRSDNGNKRWTRNTDTSCRRSTLKGMETAGPCVPDSPVRFPGVLLNWTTSSNFPTTRLLHWRFDHDDDISLPRLHAHPCLMGRRLLSSYRRISVRLRACKM